MKPLLLFTFFSLTIVGSAFSQHTLRIEGQSIPALRKQENKLSPSSSSSFSMQRSTLQKVSKQANLPTSLRQILNQSSAFGQWTQKVPSIYSYHDLGLFCKLDVQLEKTVSFPVKFRLGEVQYVDRLEGKY